MKTCLALLVILMTSCPLVSYGAQRAAVGLELQVTGTTSSGTVRVEIAPSSGKSLRIWEAGNSWGAGRWRVLIIRNGHVETFFENPAQVFTVNVPSFKEIAKGTRLLKVLDLNGGNWCGFGRCSRWDQHGITGQQVTFHSRDMIVVVYDVPPSIEAKDMGVWYGVAATVTTVP
jgi:hypothetical protein